MHAHIFSDVCPLFSCFLAPELLGCFVVSAVAGYDTYRRVDDEVGRWTLLAKLGLRGWRAKMWARVPF